MRRLGYERYAAHGGDWGAAISRELGLIAPDHVVGLHLTYLPSGVPPEPDADPDDDAERASIEARQRFDRELSGYGYLQATRPQTLAYALADSPTGQHAWIADKFKEWTDSTAAPEDAIDRDDLLTNVMLYWLTNTAGSSARIYYETAHAPGGWRGEEPSTVPTGVAVFPRDISLPVRRFAERTNRIVHWTQFERGGHFAALEAPDLLVADIRECFRKLRPKAR